MQKPIQIPSTEIRNVAVISTGHIPGADAKLLNDGVTPDILIFKSNYGWQFPTELVDDLSIQEWRDRGFTDKIPNLLNRLRIMGFDRLEFDADGVKISGLETFEW